MAYDKLRLKVADYGCILFVNMPTAARFDTFTGIKKFQFQTIFHKLSMSE